MKPRARQWVGLLLAALSTTAIWLWYRMVGDDGIDRNMFVNSPGTIYAGSEFVPLPPMDDTPRTAAGIATVMELRRASVSTAINVLGEPDVRLAPLGSVLVWHSAIHCEKPLGSGWPVAHVVGVVEGNEIVTIAIIGSFGTVQICDPPGAIGAGP